MLEIASLSVSYGKHRALSDVTLTLDRGEVAVVLGTNGAGKTTLLKAIAGLLKPAKCTRMTFAAQDLTALAPHEIVEAGIALVPEGRGIFAELTVRENLLLGAYATRARRRAENARRGAGPLPAPQRTACAKRRHHVGRRTADGGDRARTDVGARAAAARRAVARPVAAPVEGAVSGARARARYRPRHPARRAERARRSRHRGSRLHHRERPDRG